VVDVAGRVLRELDGLLVPSFARAGTRLAAQQYVRGLASAVERKNSWQLAEHAGHATPDRLQRLLGSAAWDEAGVREDVRDWMVRYQARHHCEVVMRAGSLPAPDRVPLPVKYRGVGVALSRT
jgi:hypothetical protein